MRWELFTVFTFKVNTKVKTLNNAIIEVGIILCVDFQSEHKANTINNEVGIIYCVHFQSEHKSENIK